MGPSRLLFFSYLTFIQLLVLNNAQPDLIYHDCGQTGNFTTNSAYKTNLDSVLASLSSNTKITYGFYSDSFGQNTDRVNAIALCRGDTKPDTCRSCIYNSTKEIKQSCPNQKEAIIWYGDCMLRYSNRSILGKVEYKPAVYLTNVNNVTNVNEFDQVVTTLLANLTNSAASGDSRTKFATGTANTENDQTVYALAQCTPDLSKQDCVNCLNNATAFFPQYLSGKQGARFSMPSCLFRYEIRLFYDTVSGPSPAPAPILQPSPGPATATAPSPSPNLQPSPEPARVPPSNPQLSPPPAPQPSTETSNTGAPVPLPTPPPSPQAAATPQPPTGAASTTTGTRRNIAVAFIPCIFLVLP